MGMKIITIYTVKEKEYVLFQILKDDKDAEENTKQDSIDGSFMCFYNYF